MATHSSTLAWRIPRMEKPVGCSPWGRYESDTTEQLQFHFSLSCIGEGNGNPLQCSCLENSRDGGAWWASVYGVAQSQTRLKQLSSSSAICETGYNHLNEQGFPGGASGKESTCQAGDAGDVCLILGSGRSPGRGNGNPLQYSCLENSTDRGSWWTRVHRVAKSRTQLCTCTFE